MAETTGIAWTASTFNPWRGCAKVSEGCRFCYADRLSARNPKVLGVWGPRGTRVLAAASQWQQVRRWHQATPAGVRHLVFCASLADVFEDWPGQMTDSQERGLRCYPGGAPFVPQPGLLYTGSEPYTLAEARARLWATIVYTPRLTWQLLTKRPENIARMMPAGDWPNVWLGTSVEDQDNAWRLDALQEAGQGVEVPVRFCSAEPLLGALDLRPCLGPAGINWVIVGGESGGQARPMSCDWARSLISQCELAGVACFVKQLGKAPVPGRLPLRLRSDPGHHGVMEEWPADLQVRQFPNAKEQA